MVLAMEYDTYKKYVLGTAHSDELGYLFKTIKTPQIEEGSVEDISWRKIIKLWTNFAKFGNPTPTDEAFGITWEPVENADEIKAMVIGNELKMEINPNKDVVDFWKSILDHYENTAKYL